MGIWTGHVPLLPIDLINDESQITRPRPRKCTCTRTRLRLILVRCDAALLLSFRTDHSRAPRNGYLAISGREGRGGDRNRALDGSICRRSVTCTSSRGRRYCSCASASTKPGVEGGSSSYTRRHLHRAAFDHDLIFYPSHYVFASRASDAKHLTKRWSERLATLVPHFP
jgi:hypothetical protein